MSSPQSPESAAGQQSPLRSGSNVANATPQVEFLDLGLAFSAPPSALDFVLPGLKVGTVGSLVSAGGSGKSMLALQAALTVAGGPDLLGLGRDGWMTESGSVVYLSGEDDTEILGIRLHAIGARLDAGQRKAVQKNLRVADLVGRGPDILAACWAAWIEQHTVGARLVVMDTLRRFHLNDENDSSAMASVMQRLESFASRSEAAVLVLHHSSKASALNGAAEQQAARGSSVITDNARWQANLVCMAPSEAKTFRIDESDRRKFVRLVFAKLNYSSPLPDMWFRRDLGGVLAPVDLALRPKAIARPVPLATPTEVGDEW